MVIIKFVTLFVVLVASCHGWRMSSDYYNYYADDKNICNMSAALPDPQSQCCGVDSSISKRIRGGDAADIRQYPWLALLEYLTDEYDIETLCGGSLISGKYVMTAAHCVDGKLFRKPISVRLGEYDKRYRGSDCDKHSGECSDGDISYTISETIIHPEYAYPRYWKNDIALLRLKNMVQFTDFIRPICLPTSDVTADSPKDLYLYAAGWGATHYCKNKTYFRPIKQHVELPFAPMQRCKTLSWKVGDNHICAGGYKYKSTCAGDSGGPVMYKRDGIFEVVGVVSFGRGVCGKFGKPSVNTKVFVYKKWIESKIRP